MPDRIKGITVQIGGDTTGLSKALKGVNAEIGNTQRQLKDVDRLLKLDPTNTELLRQKQELLARAVEQTEEKLDALKEAEKQVQKQFERGDIGEDQYNALKREIIETENRLGSLKTEAQKAASAVEKTDEKPIEEVADAAEDAGDELKKAGKEASNFGDYLKAGAIVEGAKSIISSIGDVVEETKEYQKIMGSLEVSSEKAGYSAEETAKTYKQLYGVLADDQTAATTTANLQALGLSQAELTQLTNATIGAWSTYGDSIPIDGLAEAINETAQVGTVTGTLADVLNWAGVSEDDFNAKLEAAGTAGERANLIMQQLASQGLVQAGEAWQQQNAALVENNQAQAAMQENMAAMSERLTPIMTAIQQGISQVLASLLQMTENVDFTMIAEKIQEGFGFFIETVLPKIQEFITLILDNKELVIAALAGIAGGMLALKLADFAGQLVNVAKGVTTLTGAFPGLGSAISLLTNPVFLVGAAIVALVTLIATKGDEIQAILQKVDDFLQNVFATDWKEVFGPVLGGFLNTFFQNVKNIWNSIKKIFDGIIDFIRGVFTGDWERVWEGIKGIFGGIWDGLVAIAKAPLNGIIGLLNMAIDGINSLIGGLNKIHIDLPDWLPLVGGKSFGINIPKIPNIPLLAKGGVLTQGSAIVGEAGPELLTVAGNQAIVQPLTTQNTQNTNLGGVNIFVYGSPGQDVNELAEIVSEKISEQTARKGAVFS